MQRSGIKMNKVEEQFYDIAAQELVTKTYKQGVMAKAFTMSPNDEKQAFANYIEFRVAQLKEELEDEVRRRATEALRLSRNDYSG